MNVDPANAITAVATVLTAFVVIADFWGKHRAQRPKLRFVRGSVDSTDWTLCYFKIYPGVDPVRFTKIVASNAFICLVDQGYDTATGDGSFHRVGPNDSSEISTVVQTEASGEGAGVADLFLYVKFKSASATRISLSKDRRFFDVRYSITTEVSSST